MLAITSCKSYLDNDPDVTISDGYAFENFFNFQGFIDEIYRYIPQKETCYWSTSFNWGEDEIMNTESTWHVGPNIDNGNFWAWQEGKTGKPGSWLDGYNSEKEGFKYRLWPNAWVSIRKANLGLDNIDMMKNATQEEYNLIKGQLLFFRAWFHFELMQYLGGLPYIDKVLPSNEELREPRLSFNDCAIKAAQDFRDAADLLPINWDDTTVGKNTLGNNDLRINKIMALGYLGKVYLWAASPLIKHGAQVGASKNGKTYDYDLDFCKLAANAFGELLTLVESGQTQYALAEFKYKDIYNHVKADGAETCYSDIFYTIKQNWYGPGTCEAIFRGVMPDKNASNGQASKTWGPKIEGLIPSDNIIHMPTANYVNLYGMANGYPLDDEYIEKSGFDKTHPFKGRDPRFYHDIVFDGFRYINGNIKDKKMEKYRYSELYTGGNVRDDVKASRTGYFTQKLSPHTVNIYDLAHSYSSNLQMYLPYMRLADIYLMYAEACAAINGAKGKSENFMKTAEEAINVLRDRVGMAHVPSEFTIDKNKFMDEVRRERAVELAFEGFRFCDLQRWLLLTEYPYNIKTSQEFQRVHDGEWYKNNDPKEAEVKGWEEKTILVRNFTEKHYWFPLKTEDVSLYPEFYQNPGW